MFNFFLSQKLVDMWKTNPTSSGCYVYENRRVVFEQASIIYTKNL